MKEIGLLNRGMAKIIAEQGHQDLLMVVDAGFAIPSGIETIDISLSKNNPLLLDVLTELRKYYSVEKMILAKQTKDYNPTLYNEVTKLWGTLVEVEVVDHSELKQLSKTVKAIIRTGDFTAYGNVILVSAAGDRWYFEINDAANQDKI